jgi:hypothetical protein
MRPNSLTASSHTHILRKVGHFLPRMPTSSMDSRTSLESVVWASWLMLALTLSGVAATGNKKPAPEPQVTSLYPMGGQRGSSFQAVIRGTELQGARALLFEDGSVTGRLIENAGNLLKVEFSAAPGATLGWHKFWVVTPAGITGEAAMRVVDEPVVEKADRIHPARRFPIVVNGRIQEPGSADDYWVEAQAGETLTMEAVSGSPRFDPSLTLFEPSGSWFDPSRLNRIAFNDEPLYFPGLSTDSQLVWRFARGGEYCIQVKGFAGQGGPDDVYQLRISPGVARAPTLHPKFESHWEERQFTRALTKDRLEQLAKRGGLDAQLSSPEIFRGTPEGSSQSPIVTLPAIIEGRLTRPGEAHLVRLKIDKPEDLAIELETPEATRPRFNPIIRLLDASGREVVTDVYNRVNNNSLQVMKMIEPKTVFGLRAPGEYTIQIHDVATDYANDDFAYRVLVRRQIAHAGNVEVQPDHMNLARGGSKPVTVSIDREEGFTGMVTVSVKGLPEGVAAVPALADQDDKPLLENAGKRERYFARRQLATVMLVAGQGASTTQMPVPARVEVSVVSGGGKLRPPIMVKDIRVMVVERGPQ